MRARSIVLPLLAAAAIAAAAEPDGAAGCAVQEGFRDPPAACALQCWWHWLDDCVTREGITRDLEAMAAAGIAEACVFAPRMSNLPATAATMSPEWLELFAFAIAEARRVGVALGFHNGPGWSASGGPWIAPEDSMKCLVSSSFDVAPASLARDGAVALPPPPSRLGFYRDLRVYAFPVEAPPRVVSAPLPDAIPLAGTDAVEWTVEFAEPFAPSVAALEADVESFCMRAEVYAEAGGEWEKRGECDFQLHRALDEPRTITLAEGAPARRWRVRFRATENPPWIPRRDIPVRSFALANWPLAGSREAIDPASLLDLGDAVRDGAIRGADLLDRLPPGAAPTWRLLRVGFTTTGGGPAPSTLGGLECDKLDRRGLAAHWRAMPARILALPGAREAVRTVSLDSWEVGPQNWTESMPESFRRLERFEIWEALPAALGYRVGNEAETGRLRGAFDAAVAELVAENYYDYFAELCRAAGVEALVEPYGGPFDPVRCGREADVPAGEFWLGSAPGHSVARAVEIARRHGRNVVAAEAFTTEAAEGRWQATPAQLRRAGDEAWMAGVNRLVYHSYVHQPFTNRLPGCSLGRHGTQLNANTTWWPQMRVWTDYVRRGQFLLRFGSIARDRHEIAPGAVEALVREGDAGERVWFVRNKSATPFSGTLALDVATGLPAAEFEATTGRVLEVVRAEGGLAVSLAPGEARFFVFAEGLRPERRPALSGETLDLSRGWRIAAFHGLAAPDAPAAADPLFDWTASADERLRYFSGAADYVRDGAFPAGILDLGEVRDVAEVRVDGALAGTLAYRPFRIEVPAGVRLEVRVVNTWPNRLIGDARRRARGEEPFTWTNWPEAWDADEEPPPSGLLGPVILAPSPGVFPEARPADRKPPTNEPATP